MKVKFNQFERVAGLFVVIAVAGVVLTAVVTAVKQGWFERKVYYSTVFESADGVHSGTPVQMAGLKAGSVEDVELEADNRIRVHFYIQGKFENRVREDSKTVLIRPFVIGERVLEVTVGQADKKPVQASMEIPSEESTDLMTIMSGKKLGSYMGQMSDMLKNLQTVMQAFLNKDRTESMVRIFDKIDPLLSNMNTMSVEVTKLSKQANKDENLQKVLANVSVMTYEINQILPALNKANPDLAQHLAQMTRNLAAMSEDVKVMSAAMKDIGPDMPGAAKRAIEALDEVTVLVKALEKNYFIRDRVKEVREEEKQRLPASKK